jgi:hypothetical protein
MQWQRRQLVNASGCERCCACGMYKAAFSVACMTLLGVIAMHA